MDAHHQHLFIITAVEDPDPAAFRQAFARPPEEIVVQFLVAGHLEGEHLEAGRVDPGQHRADRAVLASGIHRLEDQQHTVAVIGIQHMLQIAQILDQFFQ